MHKTDLLLCEIVFQAFAIYRILCTHEYLMSPFSVQFVIKFFYKFFEFVSRAWRARIWIYYIYRNILLLFERIKQYCSLQLCPSIVHVDKNMETLILIKRYNQILWLFKNTWKKLRKKIKEQKRKVKNKIVICK